ncbi:MAG: tyrosine-type recombinase/integrase [Christensenellales bacterium]|jgi:integrase
MSFAVSLHSTTRALSQAIRLGYLKSNPCANIVLPRIIPYEMHPLNEAEMKSFIDSIKGNEYETLFWVDMFTGMRLGEITGLTWDRVNFNTGTIMVDRQLQREKKKGGAYILVSVKNDQPRKLNPAPFVMGLLKEQRAKQAKQRLEAGELWGCEGGPEDLVFTNALGRHYKHNTITHNVSRIGKRIGIEGLCFHDLRHTYAVNALRAGDDVKTVQSNLGHATAAFTLDRYGHYTDDMRRDSAARMEVFAKDVINL